MFNVLTPDQVPKLWDEIKFASMKTGNITKEDLPEYLLYLLHDLLSSKAQCIVGRNAEGNLSSIMIIRIVREDMTREKAVFINSIYAFEYTAIKAWREGIDLAIKFARKNGCTRLASISANPRSTEIAKAVGFKNFYQYLSRGV